MNKTIWAIAFVVLACGVSFAIGNASVEENTQSGWENTQVAESIWTEGGNVTSLNLTANESTEKWAGAYGNTTGTILLAEAGDSEFMYNWTWAKTSGEVCVSLNDNPDWTNLGATLAATIDTAFAFGASDDDAASTLTDASSQINISGYDTATTGGITNGGWNFGAFEGLISDNTNVDDFAFCVNVTNAGTNYKGATADFELMFATSDEPGPGTAAEYFFYMELI